MTNHTRATFGSKLGVILASVGSAVGLGNIWRFPYETGQNGGAAFLSVYFLCVVLLGLPVMITEFFIGRYTRKNTAGAFCALAPGKGWNLIGYNGVLAAFLILGFYSVVAGWTLEYIYQSLAGSLGGKTAEEFAQDFNRFNSGVFRPILWTFAFVSLTHLIITSGVKAGIERSSKIMMPLLFLILVVLCIRSVTLPDASEGLKFLFQPDFGKITSSVVLSAMGQAFFSLSVGMGCLVTYASYFGKGTNLQKTAFSVTVLDTLVAVLAGVIIFPAVFSFGIPPSAGPELVFITLPNVFQHLPGAALWSCIFYVLLAIAALTSTVSLHEVATAYVLEEHRFSRRKAAFIVSAGVMALAVVSSLSFGLLKNFTIFGLTFFNLFDYVTAKLMLPFGALLTCILVGWRIDRKILKAELTNRGSIPFYFFNIYVFLLKYIAPVAIGLIFLNELGVFRWLERAFR